MTPRDRILARPAQFVAAALATALGCSKKDDSAITAPADKQVQAKPDAGLDGGPEKLPEIPPPTTPAVCLSVSPVPYDAGKFAPCLSIKRPIDAGPHKPVDDTW